MAFSRSVRLAAAAALTAAVLAGCGDDAPAALDVETSDRIELTGTEMDFDPKEIAVRAGQVEVTLHNEGTTLHDIRIEDVPFIVEARAGESDTKVVDLAPGRYRIFCSLAGHAEAGMEATLEVR